MQKFLVLYLAPASVLEGWAKTDAAERAAGEKKMQTEWQAWMQEHADIFVDKTAGVGKTKRVDAKGISDSKNDLMLYSTIQAESHDAAAKLFESHPHLGIPEAWIEIMPASLLGGNTKS